MNLKEVTDSLNLKATYESTFVSRITEILTACQNSKNLMIGIYVVEKDHFLYWNNCLKTIVGENCTKLFEDGWDFWYSKISSDESLLIKDRLTNFFAASHLQDPLTLRYHLTNKLIYFKHEFLLHKISNHTLAINYFFDVTEKERLERCFKLTQNGYRSQSAREDMHISTREKEVLQLIADGFSSKEIADMLFISNHTAISHRKNLIDKFQVKNSAHLIKKASEFSYL